MKYGICDYKHEIGVVIDLPDLGQCRIVERLSLAYGGYRYLVIDGAGRDWFVSAVFGARRTRKLLGLD